MLGKYSVHPTLPAVDIKRAKKFYTETLGLKLLGEDVAGGAMFQSGDSYIYVYQRGATKADHTVAEFEVDDIVAEMKALRAKGVKFEEYDMPEMGLKTVNGVATFKMPEGDMKSAWFKDTEGNILAIESMPAKLKAKYVPRG
jgi:catechol 2,3-dioxygenase-like lactoylglutathione lyase family enzyme